MRRWGEPTIYALACSKYNKTANRPLCKSFSNVSSSWPNFQIYFGLGGDVCVSTFFFIRCRLLRLTFLLFFIYINEPKLLHSVICTKRIIIWVCRWIRLIWVIWSYLQCDTIQVPVKCVNWCPTFEQKLHLNHLITQSFVNFIRITFHISHWGNCTTF